MFSFHSFVIDLFNQNLTEQLQKPHSPGHRTNNWEPSRHGDCPRGLSRVWRDGKQANNHIIISHDTNWEGSEQEAKISYEGVRGGLLPEVIINGYLKDAGEPAVGRTKGRGAFWGNFTYKRAEAGKNLSFLCG